MTIQLSQDIVVPQFYLFATFGIGIACSLIYYHGFHLPSIYRTSIPLAEFPRDSWIGIIKSEHEPLELRIRLIHSIAREKFVEESELAFIAYSLPEELEDCKSVEQTVKKVRERLKQKVT